LRSLALSAVRGERPPAADLGTVNAALAHDRPVHLGASGAGAALARPATTAQALARLARQAAETLAGPGAQELHQCADPDCGMLFLDPGGRRRWCSVETCGARHRVRAHRARRRAAEAG
jgi:predicted RNA-binding Zn ribbon-like protein